MTNQNSGPSAEEWLLGRPVDPPPAAPAPPPDVGTDANKQRVWRYIEGIAGRQAILTKGERNDSQNDGAYKAFRLAAGAGIPLDDVEALIWRAQELNGQLHDDGAAQVRNTMASARSAAGNAGPDYLPPSNNGHIPDAYVLDETDDTGQPTEAAQEAQDLHAIAVQRRAYELRINDEARSLWTRQRAALTGQTRPPLVNLETMLAQPDIDTLYRIDDLLPIGGRALLAAQYKAGKSTMVANLLRALVDGDPFLGRFDAQPVDRVVLIDTELDESMLRRWMRDQQIRNKQSVDVLTLRGRLTTFVITDATVRADWAQDIEGADFIILDCLRPCLDALGLSEDKEAGIFLTAFDALCKECGATEAVVVHHMGHGQERSRGDSRLLDWPDVLWKIVRDGDEDGGDNGDRYFSAIGRDVNVPECSIDWAPENRTLTAGTGNRTDKAAEAAIEDVIDVLSAPANADGLSQTALVLKLKARGVGRNIARKAVAKAITFGVILTTDGPRNMTVHILNPSGRNQ